MSPEYEQIFNRHGGVGSTVPMDRLRSAIEECEALATFANKPQVRLSAQRLIDTWESVDDLLEPSMLRVQEAILAAQPNAPKPEPVDVPFDYEKWTTGEWQAYLSSDKNKYGFPVKWIEPYVNYTMRRK
jgi:hypothetical protein